VGDPLKYGEVDSNVVISAPTSKTLTKPSLAAVALYDRTHSSVYGSKGKKNKNKNKEAAREGYTHSLAENGNIFAEKMLSQCPVGT